VQEAMGSCSNLTPTTPYACTPVVACSVRQARCCCSWAMGRWRRWLMWNEVAGAHTSHSNGAAHSALEYKQEQRGDLAWAWW